MTVFPALSVGSFQIPKDQAARLARGYSVARLDRTGECLLAGKPVPLPDLESWVVNGLLRPIGPGKTADQEPCQWFRPTPMGWAWLRGEAL